MVFRNPRALACSILSAARVLATKGPRISNYLDPFGQGIQLI